MSQGSLAVTSPTQKEATVAAESSVHKPDAALCSEPLTPEERETLVNEAEWGFRKWLRDTSPPTGFVMYPSTRQILKSLNDLQNLLRDVDLSDIAL